ncbi:MAG: flavodoxin family protein [Desulfosarcinaceae bacterium]|nr:flavodoxin family protein [Desulfosarcinaceae bacterium]
MKVLSLFGGPRKRGNTAKVLSWVEDEVKAQGHHVNRIDISSRRINGCLGCSKCKENPDEPGCIQKDDANRVIDQMVSSDIVLYASPLYYWGFSAQMKAFIDRCHCLYRGVCGSAEHTSFVEGQRQALIVTAADPFENNAELIQTSFQRVLVYDKAHSAGALFVCNCTTPGELGEEIRRQAIKFARQLFEDTPTPYPVLIPGGAPHYVPHLSQRNPPLH